MHGLVCISVHMGWAVSMQVAVAQVQGEFGCVASGFGHPWTSGLVGATHSVAAENGDGDLMAQVQY